jgi:hypothetical protein
MENVQVLAALTNRYAGLLGELKASEEEAERIKVDLVHLESVIQMYRADWSGETVAPRRPGRRFMKQGKGTQTALDIIRESAEPLTCRALTLKVMERLEIPRTTTVVKSIEGSLRTSLKTFEGRGIVREGSPLTYRRGSV